VFLGTLQHFKFVARNASSDEATGSPAASNSLRTHWQNRGRLFNLIGEKVMSNDLEKLITAAKAVDFTAEDKEEQRRSFAYGNTKIENSRITRKLIDEEAKSLAKSK
jgi:hypothetical protein